MVCQRESIVTALWGEAALVIPSYECNSPVAPDPLTAGPLLVKSAARWYLPWCLARLASGELFLVVASESVFHAVPSIRYEHNSSLDERLCLFPLCCLRRPRHCKPTTHPKRELSKGEPPEGGPYPCTRYCQHLHQLVDLSMGPARLSTHYDKHTGIGVNVYLLIAPGINHAY